MSEPTTKYIKDDKTEEIAKAINLIEVLSRVKDKVFDVNSELLDPSIKELIILITNVGDSYILELININRDGKSFDSIGDVVIRLIREVQRIHTADLLTNIYSQVKRLTLEDIKNTQNVSVISIINIDDEYYIIPTSICLLYYITEDLKSYLSNENNDLLEHFIGEINAVEPLQPISTKPTVGGSIVEDKTRSYDIPLRECRIRLLQETCLLIIKYNHIDYAINLGEHLKHSLKAAAFDKLENTIIEQKNIVAAFGEEEDEGPGGYGGGD